jgi:cyanophycinase
VPDTPEQSPPVAPGPVALVGSGEYLDVMVEVDRHLLTGRAQRVVFLPTAAAEEGEDTVRYWLELGTRHFEGLGVEPVPLQVLTREDAAREDLASLVAGAGLVYLSGGNPGYLATTLRDTAVWAAVVAAWKNGTALAGCSAGACALRFAADDVRAARAARAAGGPETVAESPWLTPSGLAVIREVAVIPHYDRMSQWMPDFAERYLARVPPEVTVVGVDEDTAIVTAGNTPNGVRSFTVAGRQSAWIIERGGHRTEFPAGSTLSVPTFTAP